MRYIPKPQTTLVKQEASEGDSGPLDVDKLLGQSGEILRREIKNLMMESSSKKLSAASARDLVAYIRLLHELNLELKDALKEMTDEELKAIADA